MNRTTFKLYNRYQKSCFFDSNHNKLLTNTEIFRVAEFANLLKDLFDIETANEKPNCAPDDMPPLEANNVEHLIYHKTMLGNNICFKISNVLNDLLNANHETLLLFDKLNLYLIAPPKKVKEDYNLDLFLLFSGLDKFCD